MHRHFYFLPASLLLALPGRAQVTPIVSGWVVNITGVTGYNGILNNVQRVQYSAANVYIHLHRRTGPRHRPLARQPQHSHQSELRVQNHPHVHVGHRHRYAPEPHRHLEQRREHLQR